MKKSIGAKKSIEVGSMVYSITYPAPVFVVGTYDESGRANMMAVAWGGICCGKPPCLGISLRKATYTYGNIVRNQAFTVSIPSVSHVREADYVGIYSGRNEDKFAATGLTPVRSELVNAPYVKEFPLVVECKVLHTIEIGIHTQFIGEMLDVKAEENVLGEDELPLMEKAQPFAFIPGGQIYYRMGEYVGKAFSVGKKPQAGGST